MKLLSVVVMTFALMGFMQEKPHKLRAVDLEEHFFLGQCPDDSEGLMPHNSWRIAFDDETEEVIARCTYRVYDE